MSRSFARLIAAATLAGTTLPARAHLDHVQDGVLAGLTHPLTGVDHLLATLGIGLLAGVAARAHRQSGPVGRSVPLRVGVAGALGGVAGALWAMVSGAAGGSVEVAATGSLLAITVALLCAERLGAVGLAAVALALAVPHGMLHASEGSGLAFFAGLALGSVALFASGAALAQAAVATARARAWVATSYAGAFVWLVGPWIA
jgi:urease accessory protein